jgi:hypothetical protein
MPFDHPLAACWWNGTAKHSTLYRWPLPARPASADPRGQRPGNGSPSCHSGHAKPDRCRYVMRGAHDPAVSRSAENRQERRALLSCIVTMNYEITCRWSLRINFNIMSDTWVSVKRTVGVITYGVSHRLSYGALRRPSVPARTSCLSPRHLCGVARYDTAGYGQAV